MRVRTIFRLLVSYKIPLFYLFLIPFFLLILKISYQRVSSFGCFDDCAVYSIGYFMTKGKVLYSEIPFNHQMLLPYVSYAVQSIFKPETIYQLLLFHRFSLVIFSLFMGLGIIVRFRLIGVGFIVIYELTKYYLFGERFLAESFIVYPLVYLFGLLWYKFEGKRIFAWEYIITGIFIWFIIFSREPYIPLAVFLYLFLIWGKNLRKAKLLSLLIFLSLSLLTALSTPLTDYAFNIINLNMRSIVGVEVGEGLISNGGFIKSFFYPLFLFWGGKWTIFRFYLIFLDLIFLLLILFSVKKNKNLKTLCISLFLLGWANIRPVIPGTIFYEAFHMIQWYGLFLMMIFLMLSSLYRQQKRLVYISSGLALSALGVLTLAPQFYLWDKVNRHEEFVTNYADYLSNGEVIRLLANPDDTLFLDNNRNDLVYWQAKIPSAYKYSWYTWLMPGFPVYDNARLEMFRLNPPDFYYGFCPKAPAAGQDLPQDQTTNYVQLYFAGRPSCLYIRKEKVKEISEERWKQIKRYEYYLP